MGAAQYVQDGAAAEVADLGEADTGMLELGVGEAEAQLDGVEDGGPAGVDDGEPRARASLA
ncbi:hypothetical protein Sliba_08260 [Streptomyces nigrescens]|uniref:Uncharacterized protein n=1 Tax=Streptomyces nigrescens TaxID=1920 RepID=A0A640T9F8_STRNI|nr:hypothetical protein Sliba_08260 [Streptomyces libani subsp. libani]GGV86789.1 hypothetical protein GCM10010500_05700 [Streptomyces libani subsp. libani]